MVSFTALLLLFLLVNNGVGASADDQDVLNVTEVDDEDDNVGVVNATEVDFVALPGCTMYSHYCIRMRRTLNDILSLEGDKSEAITDALQREGVELILAQRVADSIASTSLWFHFFDIREIGVEVQSATEEDSVAEVFSIGVVVKDVFNVNYLTREFTVSLRVVLGKVTYGLPYHSAREALNRTTENATWAVSPHSQGTYFKKLLDSQMSFEEAKKQGVNPIQTGTCTFEADATSEPMTIEEYNALEGGLSIQGTVAALNPVTDAKGFVRYLQTLATIKFRAVNEYMYPFQMNILDVHFGFIPSATFGGFRNNRYFCITPRFTGLDLHATSGLGSERLNLIPFFGHDFYAPWFNNEDLRQLTHYPELGYNQNPGSRVIPVASFRLLQSPDYATAWMTVFPFLFSVLATQLQWPTTTATTLTSANMVAAILAIQNVINSQSAYTGFQNTLTNIIYLSYGITGVYIIAVSLMVFANISREKGTNSCLVKYQYPIFAYMRLFGLLLTLFFIPLLVIYTDPYTGYQSHYTWLWWLVFALFLVTYTVAISQDVRARKKARKLEKQCLEEAVKHVEGMSVNKWTVDDVHTWLTSGWLAEISDFSECELIAIAEKLSEAKVDGHALVEIGENAEDLFKYAGLSIGEALHFSSAVKKFRADNGLTFRNGIEQHGDSDNTTEFFDAERTNI